MAEFIDYLMDGLSVGSIYALIALGYTLVYGIIKLINFAHGEFFMVGAYIGYFVISGASATHKVWSFFLGMLLAMMGVAVLAVAVEKIAYKPLRKSTRIAALLTALGMSLLLQNVAIKVFSADYRSVPTPFENKSYVIGRLKKPVGFEQFDYLQRADVDYYYNVRVLDPQTGETGNEEVELFRQGQDVDRNIISEVQASGISEAYRYHAVKINTKQIIVFSTVIILMVGLHVLVHYTKIGKAMRAVSIDKETSQLMGINVNKVISFTFLVGGALGGAAGVLHAIYYGRIDPLIGFLPGLKAFIAAVVGGIGIIPGAVIGGLVMGISENMVVGYSGKSEYRDAIAFGILILILLIKPTGILGKKEKEKV